MRSYMEKLGFNPFDATQEFRLKPDYSKAKVNVSADIKMEFEKIAQSTIPEWAKKRGIPGSGHEPPPV